jgi:hypothetical protein
MLIGKDYDKIEFDFYGFDFVEPNALIGDVIIALFAIYFGVLTRRYFKQTGLLFFKHWTWFFNVFGYGFILGGLGHFCYNYFGIPGKIPSWYSGIISTMYIELAMASLLPKARYAQLARFFYIKTFTICLIQLYFILFINMEQEPGIGLIGSTLASLTGLITSLGVLGARFSKSIHPDFWYLWLSLIVVFPSVIFQVMKINFHQWFDRNDVSHVMLLANITLYFMAVRGYFRFQIHSDLGKRSIEERGALS